MSTEVNTTSSGPSNDVPRENPTNENISFSLEHFTSEFTDAVNTLEPIDNSSQLFESFSKKPPTLENAFMSMEYPNASDLATTFMEQGKERILDFDGHGFTFEDVAVLVCFSSECKGENFNGVDSPFKKLNTSLAIADRSSDALKKASPFLFLLLKALRKLPRYVPKDKTLYRGVRSLVQTEAGTSSSGSLPYISGGEKIWWGFTFASPNIESMRSFIGGNEGTLFTLSGEGWGYDISVFTDNPSGKEILLEPERKLSITNISRNENIVTVEAKVLDTPLVLVDELVPSKRVWIKSKVGMVVDFIGNRVKEIPSSFACLDLTTTTARFSWDPVEVEGKKVAYQVSAMKLGDPPRDRSVKKRIFTKETTCIFNDLNEKGAYEFRVRCGYDGAWGKWCEVLWITLEPFTWTMCQKRVTKYKVYTLSNHNKVAQKFSIIDDYINSAVLLTGNLPLRDNKITSWGIKIKKSFYSVWVGVALININLNGSDVNEKAWFLRATDLVLDSGPPHNYSSHYVIDPFEKFKFLGNTDTDYSFIVKMNTRTGDLSYTVNGTDLGVLYEGIPLDKPLVPCVYHWNYGAIAEINFIEEKEAKDKDEIDTSIPIPTGIRYESTTWDSLTFTWDKAEDQLTYQIEFDDEEIRKTVTNTIEFRKLNPGSEHTVRVRAVKDDSVGGWSDYEEGWVSLGPSFSKIKWDKDISGFSVTNNSRRAKANQDRLTTLRADIYVPLGTITVWGIKILNSLENDGKNIYVGIVPFNNSGYCKFLSCYDLKVYSSFNRNEGTSGSTYGSRNQNAYGCFVHVGDVIGVAMDYTKGELSFAINGKGLGVASKFFKDEFYIPAIKLGNRNDAVELILY